MNRINILRESAGSKRASNNRTSTFFNPGELNNILHNNNFLARNTLSQLQKNNFNYVLNDYKPEVKVKKTCINTLTPFQKMQNQLFEKKQVLRTKSRQKIYKFLLNGSNNSAQENKVTSLNYSPIKHNIFLDYNNEKSTLTSTKHLLSNTYYNTKSNFKQSFYNNSSSRKETNEKKVILNRNVITNRIIASNNKTNMSSNMNSTSFPSVLESYKAKNLKSSNIKNRKLNGKLNILELNKYDFYN